MSWIKAALEELFSLFIDDVRFSIAILVWIAIAAFELPKLAINPDWNGALLFVGFAVILVVSVWRAAKKSP